MIAATPSVRVILYEGPPCDPLDSGLRTSLLARLLENGISVGVLRDQRTNEWRRGEARENVLVLGQFGGQTIGSDPSDASGLAEIPADVSDVSGLNLDAILSLVNEHVDGAATPGGRRWKPWFPVIDFKRCTNCMQCLSFCLFDVYGVTKDGRIQVQNENNCKTDCPACSRVCPEVAIMFPKYKAGPINGEEINSDDVRREGMKVDISALLGGDIYTMLRDRSARAKSRFSKERDDERALRERQRCLEKLKGAVGDFDIPAEVLASLPSLDQIQARAEQARQRAAQALEARASALSSSIDGTPNAGHAGSNPSSTTNGTGVG